MSVRVGSGWLKGMVLQTPTGQDTRPTAARTREAVASMLAPYWEDAVVADLFAGSGALGFEAISRGAQGAVWVENSRNARTALDKNIKEMSKRSAQDQHVVRPQVVLSEDVATVWPKLRELGPYGVVWVDPPYADVPRWATVLAREVPPILGEDGVLAVETNESGVAALRQAMMVDEQWELRKERKYGYAHVLIWGRITDR